MSPTPAASRSHAPEDRAAGRVLTGIDTIVAGEAALPRAARIGLVTNRAARTRDGVWTGEALLSAGYRIRLLLTPEHGLDAAAPEGARVPHGRVGDLPVLSLYGAEMGPVEDAVSGVDLLIVDLPDVGCRYYTYPWTAREVLRLAARHGKPVVLLDRPNPLGGVAIEGSLQDDGADSAVCASPVPVRHGLTFGELALWNQQSWGIDVALTVVAASGWCRELWGDETGLPFVPPSPNLGSFTAVLLYPGTCLIEGTNVSEGRGTDCPFQVVGAPFVDASALARELSRSSLLTGATLREVRFTATSGKWAGEECRGVELDVGDRASFHPVEAGVALIAALRRHNGFAFRAAFDRLAGTSRWREALERGAEPEEIVAAWRTDEDGFRTARAGTLLY